MEIQQKVLEIFFPIHVQQMTSEAAQEIRLIERRESLKEENEAIKICRLEKKNMSR